MSEPNPYESPREDARPRPPEPSQQDREAEAMGGVVFAGLAWLLTGAAWLLAASLLGGPAGVLVLIVDVVLLCCVFLLSVSGGYLCVRGLKSPAHAYALVGLLLIGLLWGAASAALLMA